MKGGKGEKNRESQREWQGRKQIRMVENQAAREGEEKKRSTKEKDRAGDE